MYKRGGLNLLEYSGRECQVRLINVKASAVTRRHRLLGVVGGHPADYGKAFGEEVDRLEELQQVAVFQQDLAVHDRALRVVALVQRLPVRVVHAKHVGGVERVVGPDNLAVSDRAVSPLDDQIGRRLAKLSGQVAAPER